MQWTNYLRRFHPTIPVRALNAKVVEVKKKSRAAKGQQSLYNRSQELSEMRDNGFLDPLRTFLDAFSSKQETPAHVAIIGYPNVGKSTLLNSLKRRQLSPVSANPNSTKRAVEVQYNAKLTIADCPALDPDYSDETSVIMRHGIAEVFTDDPVPALKSVIERSDALSLMSTLQIPVFRDHEEFLSKLAVKSNLRRKGGDPDILLAARTFIHNLGNGTYSTSCLPPAKSKSRFDMPQWYQDLDLSKVRFFFLALDGLCIESDLLRSWFAA